MYGCILESLPTFDPICEHFSEAVYPAAAAASDVARCATSELTSPRSCHLYALIMYQQQRQLSAYMMNCVSTEQASRLPSRCILEASLMVPPTSGGGKEGSLLLLLHLGLEIEE